MARPGVLMMSGVSSSSGLDAGRAEQVVGALIPAGTRRATPTAPLITAMLPLPVLPPVDGSSSFLLDMARLDASGRFSSRGLLRALGWLPGHRVDTVVAGDAVVFGGSATGRQMVGCRGELAVPAAARSLIGLTEDVRVVVVATVDPDLLLVHSHATVVRLLAEHYTAQMAGDRDDG